MFEDIQSLPSMRGADTLKQQCLPIHSSSSDFLRNRHSYDQGMPNKNQCERLPAEAATNVYTAIRLSHFHRLGAAGEVQQP